MERYMALSSGQSAEYWKLRDEMLTPKYKLQDYGCTILLGGIGLFITRRKSQYFLRSPKSKAILIVIAVSAPILSVGAYVFDLLQGMYRGEYPHWADSLGIPFAGLPFLLTVAMLWSLAHLGFIHGSNTAGANLSLAVSARANWWLLFVSGLTTVLVALLAIDGAYWYALPGVLWLYFYLSLAANRIATNDVQQTSAADNASRCG